MMRSMFSGVSGLRAHQTRMDVIGNNIANVNTVGFKSGRVTFQEVFSQTLRGAGAPDDTTKRAGTNPMQVGLGTGVASIDTIMTEGSTQRTDNPLDMSVEGEGFFVVKGSTADTYKFTRAGNFAIDEHGTLNLNGMAVYGWDSKYSTKNDDGSVKFDTEAPIEPINLAGDKLMIKAKATDSIVLAGNLDASQASGLNAAGDPIYQFSVPIYAYDSLGNKHKITVNFNKKDTSSNTWRWKVSVDDPAIAPSGAASGSVVFKSDGTFDHASSTDNNKTLGSGVQVSFSTTNGSSNPMNISFNFKDLSQWASENTAKTSAVNGSSSGTFVSLSAGTDGIITGVYSNGEQQALGMVAVATFPNPGALMKVGGNLFIPSTNSGQFTKAVKPGTNGAGPLSPGTLEMSNVDLSREFTDMIVTQRGFQANSRIITTSDEMLQELVNLKR